MIMRHPEAMGASEALTARELSAVRSRKRPIAVITIWLLLVVVTCILRMSIPGQRAIGADLPATGDIRFTYVDIMLDPKGQSLAAWQVEVAAEVGEVSLVGVETGEHPAYAKRPAYYDPAALKGRRMIVGDFSLDANLPKAKTRVCRLMLEIKGAAKPVYAAKVMAAADSEGRKLDVMVEVIPSPN